MNAIQWLTALMPVLSVAILLVGLRMPAGRAMPLALAITVVLALLVWQVEPVYVSSSIVEGLIIASSVVYIVLGAIALLGVLRVGGGLDAIRGEFQALTADSRVQVLLVGWLFVCFMEGAAGFGTPAPVAAPLLMALGLRALPAVALTLIADVSAVTFGAVGTPILVGIAQGIGLDPSIAEEYERLQGIALTAAGIDIVVGIMVPVAMMYLLTMKLAGHRSPQAFREAVPMAVAAALSYSIPAYLSTRFLGVEFGGILGGAIGMVIFILLIRRGLLMPTRKWTVADGYGPEPAGGVAAGTGAAGGAAVTASGSPVEAAATRSSSSGGTSMGASGGSGGAAGPGNTASGESHDGHRHKHPEHHGVLDGTSIGGSDETLPGVLPTDGADDDDPGAIHDHPGDSTRWPWWKVWGPYLLLTILLLATRLIDPLKELLNSWSVGITDIFGTGISSSFEPLYSPGFIFLIVVVVTVFLHKVPRSEFGPTSRSVGTSVLGTALVLAAAVPLVRVFLNSDVNDAGLSSMPLELANAASASLGSSWPLAAPFVGALGSFVSGSATFSHLMFADLQANVASSVGLETDVVLAQQVGGANAGNMVCVSNVVAVAGVAGLLGQEGTIIRQTVLVMTAYTVAFGIAGMLLA